MSGFGDKIKGFFSMDNMYDENYDNGYSDYDNSYDDDYDTDVETSAPRRSEKKKTTRTSSEKEYDFLNDYDEPDEEFEKPAARTRSTRRSSRQSKVVSMNDRPRSSKAEIVIMKPTSMDDSRDIVDRLLEGKAIVLNFEGTNTDLAQRVIDSVGGACCAVDGTIRKVSGYIYIVAPVSIELSGDYADITNTNPYDYKSNRYQF